MPGHLTSHSSILLHRLKRLWRFLDNERVDPIAVQAAVVPEVVARLGHPKRLGLATNWTMFDVTLPGGRRVRSQVLRIAIPRRGRALPLLQAAYDRDRLPPDRSQNQLEEVALDAVLRALPCGVRAVVLADRGFARATFLEWLRAHPAAPDFVVRIERLRAAVTPWRTNTNGLAARPSGKRLRPIAGSTGGVFTWWRDSERSRHRAVQPRRSPGGPSRGSRRS